jgi:hypothetical protein
MAERNHATIGDALIFMAKAAVVVAVLAIGVFSLAVWDGAQLRKQLATERQKAELLGRQKNALLAQNGVLGELQRRYEVMICNLQLPEGYTFDDDLAAALARCRAGAEPAGGDWWEADPLAQDQTAGAPAENCIPRPPAGFEVDHPAPWELNWCP